MTFNRHDDRVSNRHFSLSDCLELDKEPDGGVWLLTCQVPSEDTVLRLRIEVTAPWDWFRFTAEIIINRAAPHTVGRFELAPLEIIPRSSDRFGNGIAERWDPTESDDFLQIPVAYQSTFEVMVRRWGKLAGLVVPAVGLMYSVH